MSFASAESSNVQHTFKNFNTTEFLESILGSTSFSEDLEVNLGNNDSDFKDEMESGQFSRSSSELSFSTDSIPNYHEKEFGSSDSRYIKDSKTTVPHDPARSIFASLRNLNEDKSKGRTNDQWPGGKPKELAALEMLRMQKLFREIEEKYTAQISDLRSQLTCRKEDFRDLVSYLCDIHDLNSI